MSTTAKSIYKLLHWIDKVFCIFIKNEKQFKFIGETELTWPNNTNNNKKGGRTDGTNRNYDTNEGDINAMDKFSRS